MASAGIRIDLALFKHVLRKRFEIVLSGLDVGSNAGVPAAVAFVDEVLQSSVGSNGRRDLQATCERIHAANVGVKQIYWIGALASQLGVEVDASRPEATMFENGQHAASGQIDVGWELIGVPA